MADAPEEGDLALDLDGDLLIEDDDLVLWEGASAVASDVAVEFQLWEGEWFLDLDAGFPYLRVVFVKNPDESEILSLARARILARPGVASVQSLSIDLDRQTREAVLTFRALGDLNELIADQVETKAP